MQKNLAVYFEVIYINDFKIISVVDLKVIRTVDFEINSYYFEVNSGTSRIKHSVN